MVTLRRKFGHAFGVDECKDDSLTWWFEWVDIHGVARRVLTARTLALGI